MRIYSTRGVAIEHDTVHHNAKFDDVYHGNMQLTFCI